MPIHPILWDVICCYSRSQKNDEFWGIRAIWSQYFCHLTLITKYCVEKKMHSFSGKVLCSKIEKKNHKPKHYVYDFCERIITTLSRKNGPSEKQNNNQQRISCKNLRTIFVNKKKIWNNKYIHNCYCYLERAA